MIYLLLFQGRVIMYNVDDMATDMLLCSALLEWIKELYRLLAKFVEHFNDIYGGQEQSKIYKIH